ncbi:MAG: hypothetical protein Phog2KO_41460 [Phototrophicaceae bacterium]
MTLFDLSEYNLRQLDPKQGTKPLDFGGGGITGSVNLDGRFIAINTYHPEHGYITLTSIPPFPDEDRYDQQKVRAYRKSLVSNEGFGLTFEQEIIKRDYFLIADFIPFIRFTLADGAIAECVTYKLGSSGVFQAWKFSQGNIKTSFQGEVWFKRAEYTQLTEGGVVPMPSIHTEARPRIDKTIEFFNNDLNMSIMINGIASATINPNKGVTLQEKIKCETTKTFLFHTQDFGDFKLSDDLLYEVLKHRQKSSENNHLIINRAISYGNLCITNYGCLLTDHMILPLLWTRDSFYVMDYLLKDNYENENHLKVISLSYIQWLFEDAWRGTYCKSKQIPIASAWARSYMANGMPKDNRAFQLDQQIFPFLALANYLKRWKSDLYRKKYVPDIEKFLNMFNKSLSDVNHRGLFPTDETPADDDIPLHFHFSSHILLWYTLHRLKEEFVDYIELTDKISELKEKIKIAIPEYFITEHNGKQIYSYATDGEGKHYIYHDANDIPLVMMPLWGFCEKDDPIWLNTVEFAFSSENSGFYDGVLGSVHTPAPWALGDAQELILSKVLGDRERYQRVWERVEKAAQWDGALPEAYDANTFEVVSRHWFAWTNAMVAIADSISWEWETEGEYAR